MDQTTDTGAWTETEKYLVNATTITTDKFEFPPDSADEDEDSAQDALLGGIRSGIRTMTKTARSALSNCKTKTELDDAISKIQAASLNLLKMEKSFLKTASIVSEVVDQFASDFDEDDQPECIDNKGSGDGIAAETASATTTPRVFCPSLCNRESMEGFKKKLKKEYNKRMGEYKDSLTDEILKEDEKFEALLKQIKMGKSEAETSISNSKKPKKKAAKVSKCKDEEISKTDKVEDSTKSFLASIPFTADELKHYAYMPYNADKEMDDSVLPSVDPISRNLIVYPVINKYCNHVFDRSSVYAFIAANPDAICPVPMCRNKRTLQRDHFITDSILTAHVRRKNNF